MSDKKHQLVIDLEMVSHKQINGIGMFVGDRDGNVHFKENFWIKVPEETIDPFTRDDFWAKYTDHLLEYAQKNGKDEETQVKAFVSKYDNIHSMIGVEEKDIDLVSDNAEFDFGNLSTYILKYYNREPLRYTKQKKAPGISEEGNYRCITDYTDTMCALGVSDVMGKGADKIQVHDHQPANDAEHNWALHLITEEFITRMKRDHCDILEKVAREATDSVVERIKTTRASKRLKTDKDE